MSEPILPLLGLDPSAVASLPPEALPGLLAALAAVQAAVAARLAVANPTPLGARESGHDEMLTAAQAAGRTGMSRRWLYANAKDLPFAVRTGQGSVRFSARGIEKWLAQRKEQQRRSAL
jgi:predicted DNA-binding transcriptional regulator AlpA